MMIRIGQSFERRHARERFVHDLTGSDASGRSPRWYGTGARALGLAAAVNEHEFVSVANATDPRSGHPLHNGARPSDAAGWIVRFRAPRAVEMLATADAAVARAIGEAASDAITAAEYECRAGEGTLSRSLVAAAVEHVSYGDDGPALEVRAAILALTRLPAGGFAPLAYDFPYRARPHMSSVFALSLRAMLRAAGYRVAAGRDDRVLLVACDEAVAS